MFIYAITNQIDGKKYVGKTEKTIDERWRTHRANAWKQGHHSENYLYRALRKHGPENFVIEQLAEAQTAEELNQFEKQWIASLNTIAPNGYNMTTGGEGVPSTPEIREKQRRKMLGRATSAKQKLVTSQIFKGKPKPPAQRAKMAASWNAARRKDQSEIAKAVNATENAKLHDYECPDCKTRFVQITRTSYAGHRRWCLNYRDI